MIFCKCGCGGEIVLDKRGRQMKYLYGHGNRGRKFSKEHHRKTSLNHANVKKENNPNWKGNNCITPLTKLLRTCESYINWRSLIFQRDGYTCEVCKKVSGKLNAHHIIPFSRILKKNNVITYENALQCKELWNINNGVTLCEKCHIKTFQGKGN